MAFSAAEWKCDGCDLSLNWFWVVSSNYSMGDFCVDIQRIGDRHGNWRIQNPIWCILCDACRCFETCPPTTKWNIDILRFGHTIIGINEHLVPAITNRISKKIEFLRNFPLLIVVDKLLWWKTRRWRCYEKIHMSIWSIIWRPTQASMGQKNCTPSSKKWSYYG